MKQKIAIIGAGITGLSIAKYLSKKNYDITIYEKKSEIGGVMRDILEDQEIYFKYNLKKKFKNIQKNKNINEDNPFNILKEIRIK